jgi:D-alanyl-D-alanine carboxypeptidase/D-alanyl-D-alanine-endopeptidase (penicillin-binding protein 4)
MGGRFAIPKIGLGAGVMIVSALGVGANHTMNAGATQDPVPQSLLDTIEEVTSQARYDHSTWGFRVTDRETGDVLFDQAGEPMFVTGSILKVFSTSTALHEYGPDYRFHTPVYRTGPVRGGNMNGDLVLVASGDLSMGLREKPDGTMVYDSAPNFDHTYANTGLHTVPVDGDPLAGLDELAQKVASSGIRRINGDVIIDDRLFDTFFGWLDAETSPMTPIWINENRIDITSTPGDVGEQATVDYRPKTAAYTVENAVETVAAGSETDIEVSLPRPGVFRVEGQIPADAGPTLRVGEIPNPAEFARTAFIEALERAGVQVRANATGPNDTDQLPAEGSYPAGDRVAEHVSAKLSEFIKVILKVSHNPGADLMACLNAVAAGSKDCDDGLAAEAEYVSDSLGVPDDSFIIFDGAGSDERDRASGSAMTTFLRALDSDPIGPPFEQSLSILGVDGDLAETAADTPAAGHVRLKTGTRVGFAPSGQGIVTGRTMIGYADAASGREIIISVMVRDVPVTSLDDLFAVIDDAAAIAVAMQQAY